LYLLFYIVDPTYVCTCIQYFQQSLSATSLWFMVFLSLERSITFTRPLLVKKFSKSRTIYFTLFLMVVLCFGLHIDEILSVEIKAFRWVNFAYGLCSMKRHSRLLTDRIKILFHSQSFIFPFLFNSILDIYISYQICQRRQNLLGRSMSISRRSKKSRRSKISLANEITLTLLCQSFWLLITYFPARLYYSLISFKIIDDHDRDDSRLIFVIRLNLLIYLAFSPTLYVILSPTLRREIYFYLSHSSKRSKSTNSSFLSSAHRKLDKYMADHRPIPSHRSRLRLSILTSRSEELPRQSIPVYHPVKQTLEYTSYSVPCLSVFQHENEQLPRMERASTIHHWLTLIFVNRSFNSTINRSWKKIKKTSQQERVEEYALYRTRCGTVSRDLFFDLSHELHLN
jgi:hypothetical protein